MLVENILNEVDLAGAQSLEGAFNEAIENAFSPSFVAKINKNIGKILSLKEVVKKDSIMAYQQGNTIFINRPVFFAQPKAKQIKTLLHEFSHVLQTKKNLFVFQTFPEINEVTKNLYNITRTNLVKPLSVFLVSKNIKLITSDKEEMLAYLMNGEIDWTALKPEGKIAFQNELRECGLFNMNSSFWKNIL